MISYKKEIDLVLNEQQKEDFIDRINYVSKHIISVEFDFTEKNIIVFNLENEDQNEINMINEMTDRQIESYRYLRDSIVSDNNVIVPNNTDVWNQLLESGQVIQEDNGVMCYTGICLKLFDFFNQKIKEIGSSIGAVEHKYPTLISVRTMQRIKYLVSRPESINFVSRLNEDFDQIDFFSESAKKVKEQVEMNKIGKLFITDQINSSAVCFHTYNQYKDKDLELKKEPIIIGAEGKCFRYESKSMHSFERLRDFSMREIIVLGTERMVDEFIKMITVKCEDFFKEIGMNYYLAIANDPFFTKEFSTQSMFQRNFSLKVEINARINGKSNRIAIGSINNHRDYLGKGFNIMNHGNVIHSGCAAFGIERCFFAFLEQFGLEMRNWPSIVVDGIGGLK